MKLAIIPARGGSKRIPRKNIRDFCGLPMIVRSIKAAQESQLFDDIVVSTDDEEIAEIACSAGAQIPFMRPGALSDDLTATLPVVAHAIEECTLAGLIATQVCCIYPCAPFILTEDLLAAHELLLSNPSKFVYPVAEYPHPIQRALRIRRDHLEFAFPNHETTRTQDLEVMYHDCGMFYWGSSSAWLNEKRLHSNGIGLAIPRWRVEDIDSEEDWRRAEVIFACLGQFQEAPG